MTHAWCSDPSRDAAVRAAEDGRDRPLPTLEECIEQVKQATFTAGVTEAFFKSDAGWVPLTREHLQMLAMIPKSVSASSAPEQENKGDSIRPPTTKTATVENDFSDAAERSAEVNKAGEGQSGLRTERVTLEVTHDLDARLSDWIVEVVDESLGLMESVRVVEEAKLAPHANADGGSNHSKQAASGWRGSEGGGS